MKQRPKWGSASMKRNVKSRFVNFIVSDLQLHVNIKPCFSEDTILTP